LGLGAVNEYTSQREIGKFTVKGQRRNQRPAGLDKRFGMIDVFVRLSFGHKSIPSR